MSGRDIGIVALVIVGVLVLVPLLGGGMMGGWGMGPGMMGPGMMGGQWYGGRGGWGGGMYLVGGLFWLAILAGIALLITSAVRQQGPSRRPDAEELPLDILKRRLAKGEITLEEYESLKKELS